MAPYQNVLDVRALAADHFPHYPIVTESGRWIRVTLLFDDWDATPLVKTLQEEGYRAKQLRTTVKVTKDDMAWPDASDA